MLWVKAFHIVFVVAWFAGLFYLPRLFIYHLEAEAEGSAGALARFVTMERRLLGITHIGALLALLFGIWLLVLVPAWLQQGWLHAKLALVLLLFGYHGWCMRLAADFASGRSVRIVMPPSCGCAPRTECGSWYAPAANGFDAQHLSTVLGRALRERPCSRRRWWSRSPSPSSRSARRSPSRA